MKKFITENKIEIPAVSTTEMKEIDRIASEETGPNLFQMMENAGRSLAELAVNVINPKSNNQNIVILAGTSGNGGGGICAARHLANRGFNVTVVISEPERLKDLPKYQLQILQQTNAEIVSINELKNINADLIIDAIIGYSIKGEPKGKALELINWANNNSLKVISLDVPSGINATTGRKSKNFIRPDLTLTLALPKTGLLPEITGELYLADIGIPSGLYKKININVSAKIFQHESIIKIFAKEFY